MGLSFLLRVSMLSTLFILSLGFYSGDLVELMVGLMRIDGGQRLLTG